jgi:adenylyltransferase/sulfurtransferase
MVDADIIEAKNMERSMLLREGAFAGANKVSHLRDRLRVTFPHTEWNGEAVEIADLAAEYFSGVDVLFSCVDTDLARTEIAALAARYKFPVCDAGLGGISIRVGRVSWLPGGESTACFACLLTAKRRAELLSMWESDVKACWVENAHEQSTWTSTPAMASIVAGLQIETAIAAKTRGADAFTVHLDLDRVPISETIRHRRSAECPFHEEMPEALFPICTRAECGACGTESYPGRRIGWLRRWGTCQSCGGRDLLVRETLHETQTVSGA